MRLSRERERTGLRDDLFRRRPRGFRRKAMKPGYPGGVVFSAPSTTIQEPPVPPVRHHYDPVSPAVTSSQSGNFLPASLLVLGVMMVVVVVMILMVVLVSECGD